MTSAALKGAEFSSPWFPHGVDRNARLRVFCLPYAGGGSLIYRPWRHTQQFPAGVDICPVQLPGRETRIRESAHTTMTELVDALAPEIANLPYCPYVLFGHSMGALIAFELAHRLTQLGTGAPERLFVSGASAPHLPRDREDIELQDDAALVERIRRLNGTRHGILENSELSNLILPLIRADFELCDGYEYAGRRRLDCPITAYGGLRDEHAPAEKVAAWASQTNGSFTLEMIEGDHFFITRNPVVLIGKIIRTLCDLLGSAGPDTTALLARTS